ncbi:hypothetical protein BKA61DRAFT_719273 [Leptodontidium sp. MPI-SDFR-AT-0119]|nr:hypothetical protein BKA61DRAFT_719273 [Leptodontidium sp. MPI-SDFR-AT-0119]
MLTADRARNPQQLLELVKLVVKHDGEALQDPFKNWRSARFFISGDNELVKWLLGVTHSTYWQNTFQDCLQITLKVCFDGVQPYMASLFQGLLPNTEIDGSVSMVKDKCDKYFLHCSALNLGQLHGMAIRHAHLKSWGNDYTAILEIVKSKVEFQQLLSIVRGLVTHTSDLHGRAFVVKYSHDDRRIFALETPFSALVTGVMDQDLFRPATGDLVPEATSISVAVRIWL